MEDVEANEGNERGYEGVKRWKMRKLRCRKRDGARIEKQSKHRAIKPSSHRTWNIVIREGVNERVKPRPRTRLVSWPVLLLAARAAVDDLVAGAAALELRRTRLGVVAALARAALQRTYARGLLRVRPRPHVRRHPRVLRDPEVVVRVFGAVARPGAAVQVFWRLSGMKTRI